ncbi:response regulator [Puia sp. P3]|uniref:response regulator n=1 Tax=Puia sp. P3 TaxID=3423952 RepID=UPI003D67F3BD
MVKRFLLIDDDSDDRELFSEALSMVEPAIICDQATDGEEGLALLQQNKEEPDLIFLDINMPILNGWQLLSRLKASALKHIPVIMYSTSSNAKDKRTAQELGALCFITKPHAFRMLKGMLNVVVEHANRKDYGKLCEAVHAMPQA